MFGYIDAFVIRKVSVHRSVLDRVNQVDTVNFFFFLFSFNRIGSTNDNLHRSIANTKVTLPLTISFASQSFQLYAIIRIHSNGIKYDAVLFDISKSEGVTKRAMLINENGVRTTFDEFNDLRHISSTNVILALYDDSIERHQLIPKPIVEQKPDVASIEILSHISPSSTDLFSRINIMYIIFNRFLLTGQLRLSRVHDEWTDKLMKTRHNKYIVHDILPSIIDCKSYLPHHIPRCKYVVNKLYLSSYMIAHCHLSSTCLFSVADVGKYGFILIIRHFVDEKNIHDHIVHDCAFTAGDCRCELITKIIQPKPTHRQAIDRRQADHSFYSSLLRTLKWENVICAYSNDEFHIDVSCAK